MTEVNQRKPISKKMRFDVFKRDSFICIYCGGHPPKVILEVDHVIPVCQGGKNRTDNLVTACFDCNRGKGKHSLESVPESLLDKATKIKEAESQLKAYRKILEQQKERLESDAWVVIKEFYGDHKTTIETKKFHSFLLFVEKLDIESVITAVRIALARKGHDMDAAFLYFCGICWRSIKGEGLGAK